MLAIHENNTTCLKRFVTEDAWQAGRDDDMS